MRGFTSRDHAQRFVHVHGVIQNLFRVGRHLLRAVHHRMLRARSFTVWQRRYRIVMSAPLNRSPPVFVSDTNRTLMSR